MKKPFFVLVLLLCSTAGFAHVFPDRADPPVGSTVIKAPDHVSIFFDDAVQPILSTIRVLNKGQLQIDKKDSHVDVKNPVQLEVGLPVNLPAGEYRVEWKAASEDGHTTTGHFSFWIKDRIPQ